MAKKKGSIGGIFKILVRRLTPTPKTVFDERLGVIWAPYAEWGAWESWTDYFDTWLAAFRHYARFFHRRDAYKDIEFGLFEGRNFLRILG